MNIELTDREVELIEVALTKRYEDRIDAADFYRYCNEHESFERQAEECQALQVKIATHKGT